jgi:hypothetical protein
VSSMTKIATALALVASLGVCASQAAISDISDSAVRVEGNWYFTDDAAYLAEASRGCGMYGKTPVKLSHRWVIGNVEDRKQVLFACK